MRNVIRGLLTILLATIAISSVVPAIRAQPPSPAFWVVPSTETFNTNTTSVGTLFNVTVTAAAVNGTDAWGVQLGFNASQLQAVAVGLTDVATSMLFAGHSTTPLGPIIDNTGNTAGYPGVGSVEIAETLIGNDFIAAASASVFYVTFNVTVAPAAGQTLSSLIDPAFGLPLGETVFILQSPSTIYPTGEIDNPNTAPCAYSFVAGGAPLSVLISPSSVSVTVNQTLLFTSNVAGGTPSYSFQWFLNGALVPGATLDYWTFSSVTSGSYVVYLSVTDSLGATAESNVATVTVYASTGTIGVKTGDWIKLEFTANVTLPGVIPEWIRLEFLSVVGSQASVEETIHMSDGTEQNFTVNGDIMAGDLVFVIPANMTTGDSMTLNGFGTIVIAGETTRTYAGASRTVVWTNIEESGTQLTYYWDRQTGIIVEVDETSTSPPMTVSYKAVETNMWSPAVPVELNIQPVCLNLQSKGRWITATIVLPEGYSAGDVDVSSMLLNGTVPAEKSSSHANSLTVKFERTAVSMRILTEGIMWGNVTLTVSGRLADGTMFEGSDTIKVKMPGDVNMDGKVDIRDASLAAKAYGSTPNSAGWNPAADENEDGKIDIRDINAIAKLYGTHYP